MSYRILSIVVYISTDDHRWTMVNMKVINCTYVQSSVSPSRIFAFTLLDYGVRTAYTLSLFRCLLAVIIVATYWSSLLVHNVSTSRVYVCSGVPAFEMHTPYCRHSCHIHTHTHTIFHSQHTRCRSFALVPLYRHFWTQWVEVATAAAVAAHLKHDRQWQNRFLMM